MINPNQIATLSRIPEFRRGDPIGHLLLFINDLDNIAWTWK
jgi:hypothetical protein